MSSNRNLIVAFAALLIACPPSDLVAEPKEPRSAYYSVAGHGSPALVFVSGVGESRRSWSSITPLLSAETTVFAYDRPGTTSNPDSPRPFKPDEDGLVSTEEAVRDLRDLLTDAGIPPPYVLVAHSLGGSYTLKFAQLFPEEVAGIVMIDARVPSLQAQCFIEAPDYPELCRPLLPSAAAPAHVRAEIAGNLATETEGPTAEELGNLPITFIAAAETTPRRAPSPDELAQLSPDVAERLLAAPAIVFAKIGSGFKTAQRTYAESAINGRFVEAEDSGHHVHQDRPQLVVDEIRSMIDRVRNR